MHLVLPRNRLLQSWVVALLLSAVPLHPTAVKSRPIPSHLTPTHLTPQIPSHPVPHHTTPLHHTTASQVGERPQERSEAGKADTLRTAYFASVAKLRHLAAQFPELLLLPWEHMRKMGVVKQLQLKGLSYTFFTHQWEDPEHPFRDLKQIVRTHPAV